MKVSITRFLINKIKSGLGIVQDTDTATQAISKGKYVFWKGVLKKVSSAIGSGDTLSSSNLSDVSEGVLNELAGQIVTNDATTSVHGLMSAADKASMNRMANGNSYVTGNADNYRSTGFYTVAAAPTNIPEGYGILLVFATGDFVLQVYFRPSKMYERRYTNGSWDSWKSVALS